MLKAVELPSSIAHLDACLTDVDGDALSHRGCSLQCAAAVTKSLKIVKLYIICFQSTTFRGQEGQSLYV